MRVGYVKTIASINKLVIRVVSTKDWLGGRRPVIGIVSISSRNMDWHDWVTGWTLIVVVGGQARGADQ